MGEPLQPDSDRYDAIVIGAGAGGMTAAAVAAAEGLKVLLVEKTEFVGGTTAWSGGMVWIPANPKMRAIGIADTFDDALNYLVNTVPESENAELRRTYLSRGSEAIEYLEANTLVRLVPVQKYPDYYPERPGSTPGGRVLEPLRFNGATLGKNFGRLRPPLPEFTLFGGMMVNRLDIPHLRNAGRSIRSTVKTARLIAAYALQRLRHPRGTTLHLGNALAARLYASLISRKVDILFGAHVSRLVTADDGRVAGVEIEGANGGLTIHASRGVVLATGGFSHDATLRRRFFPSSAGAVSATNPAGTGDGLQLANGAGASIGSPVASPAYWAPASLFQRNDGTAGVFPHTVTDRAKPGVIAVNAAGKRFVNEALSYHEFVLAMLRNSNVGGGSAFYLICDSRFLWTYGLGRIQPFTRRIGPYIEKGELIEGANLPELARNMGVEESALRQTLESYNVHARQGFDPEFDRGSTIYQRHLGDAGHTPNPCVAPIERPPFYAMQIYPADLGTAIGVQTDSDARALKTDGTVIDGLYVCGNDMNSIMNGNYPGPGITLGPALTFGYLAGIHLSRRAN